MIPKIIHYCWYGRSEPPLLYQKCISTWRKNLPDYEIRLWNEQNTDFDNDFLQSKLKRKEWAFISDYIRMRAIYSCGGIYLDADVEIIRSLNPLLAHNCFLGYETKERITSGVIASIKNHPLPLRCMKLIETRHAQGKPYLIAPEVATIAHSLSTPAEKILDCPPEYFYPYNPYDPDRPLNNFMYADVTPNTYGIHHWGKSWKQSPLQRLLKKILKK